MSEPKIKGRRYDWLAWFGRPKTKLIHGEDYNCTTIYFASYIRRAAKRHGYLVSLDVGEGEIELVVNGKVNPDPAVHNNKYRKGK